MRRTRRGEDESSIRKKCDDRINPLRLEMMLTPTRAIHRICLNGDLRSLLSLLAESKNKDIVNEKNLGGVSSLYFAAAKGNVDICKVLLRSGAKVESNARGISPLHVAAAFNQSKVTGLLLEYASEKEKSQKSKILGDTRM